MPDNTPISCIVGLDHYQSIAFETAVFPKEIGPLYCAMGALGESGELVEVMLQYYLGSVHADEMTDDFKKIVMALQVAVQACKTVERLKKAARKGELDLPRLPELTDEVRARVKSEQGDCMWYQGGTATVTGNKLSTICQQNITKLRERRDAGVIASSGETIADRRAANDNQDSPEN